MKRLRIEVTGVVQGVGFRPFVYGLARDKGLAGFVRNSSSGVEIEVEGREVGPFADEVRAKAPPLADITSLSSSEIPAAGDEEFVILPSLDGGESTFISPDVSTCADCFGELLDPGDRRYLYPFTNCTNCGPRYSITRSVPYDRPNTTMAPFTMCSDCSREYHDPRNRRFHAQPNACPLCGPEVELAEGETRTSGRNAVAGAVDLLRRGAAVAVRGIGGYHLAVDAGNADAVARLRERKRRSNKAFALMAPDIETVRRFARTTPEEEALLLSRERPVVLLERAEKGGLPEEVAPGVPEIGFMLPYSPLHALLFFQRPGGESAGPPNFPALVMTSGNRSEEPVVKEREAAEKTLAPFVDAFLHHDREIFMRVDDSVVRSFEGQTIFIRRARGYVPAAIHLEVGGPEVLACGADLKSTLCLTTEKAAVVSQHIGDRENGETLDFFEETLANLKEVYRVEPAVLAHDLHPGYFSTRWAMEQGGMERRGIQHHHAHVASVMAEKGLRGPVVGVALDGSGYGGDGTVWGGEILIAEGSSFERAGHFLPLPMPGGEAAARNPWQMALSCLTAAFGGEALEQAERAGLLGRCGRPAAENVLRILENRSLSPLTSGAGRLFEAVASILGARDVNSYEGEAAMALEGIAAPGIEERYPFDIGEGYPAVIDFTDTIRALVEEFAGGVTASVAAAKFHSTVTAAASEGAAGAAAKAGVTDVALSGGVFQNRLLLDGVVRLLRGRGLTTHFNTRVPANDAGISLGQAFLLRCALED